MTGLVEAHMHQADIRTYCWISLILLMFAALSCQREPQSYEDCVLQNVKPSMAKETAQVVMQACAMKFAKPEPVPQPLTWKQFSTLDGRAGYDYGTHFSGTVYNPLDDITVTELDIDVTTSIGGDKVTKTYRAEVMIPPKTSGTFDFNIIVGDQGAAYNWVISAAKGTKASK